jgi:hypothetical protein
MILPPRSLTALVAKDLALIVVGALAAWITLHRIDPSAFEGHGPWRPRWTLADLTPPPPHKANGWALLREAYPYDGYEPRLGLEVERAFGLAVASRSSAELAAHLVWLRRVTRESHVDGVETAAAICGRAMDAEYFSDASLPGESESRTTSLQTLGCHRLLMVSALAGMAPRDDVEAVELVETLYPQAPFSGALDELERQLRVGLALMKSARSPGAFVVGAHMVENTLRLIPLVNEMGVERAPRWQPDLRGVVALLRGIDDTSFDTSKVLVAELVLGGASLPDATLEHDGLAALLDNHDATERAIEESVGELVEHGAARPHGTRAGWWLYNAGGELRVDAALEALSAQLHDMQQHRDAVILDGRRLLLTLS